MERNKNVEVGSQSIIRQRGASLIYSLIWQPTQAGLAVEGLGLT